MSSFSISVFYSSLDDFSIELRIKKMKQHSINNCFKNIKKKKNSVNNQINLLSFAEKGFDFFEFKNRIFINQVFIFTYFDRHYSFVHRVQINSNQNWNRIKYFSLFSKQIDAFHCIRIILKIFALIDREYTFICACSCKKNGLSYDPRRLWSWNTRTVSVGRLFIILFWK